MKSSRLVVGVVFLLFSIILILVFSPHVSMKSHGYGEWWLFYLVAFALILSICIFCKFLVGREKGILEWLGKNSLTIMCIHEPIKRILLFLISKVSGLEIITLRTSIVYSLGLIVLLIILLTPIVIAINRYIPWVIGNRKVSVDTKQLANQPN